MRQNQAAEACEGIFYDTRQKLAVTGLCLSSMLTIVTSDVCPPITEQTHVTTRHQIDLLYTHTIKPAAIDP